MIILTQPEMADKAIVLFGLDDDNDKADDDDVEEDNMETKKNAYLFARTPGSGLNSEPGFTQPRAHLILVHFCIYQPGEQVMLSIYQSTLDHL